MFDADELPQFWLLVGSDYPSLSDKARMILLPVTKCLCES
jgi:hypothetical protein